MDEEVTFNGSFTDPGSDDTHAIEWDFGDNTGAENTLTPTHVYEQAGDFTVTLTVTDDDGGVGRDDLTVTVEDVVVEVVPIADAGPAQEANEGDTVRFAGAASPSTGGEIVSFDWDFGDGETAEGAIVTHVYADDGVFTATLLVTDDQGLTGEDTAIVTVNNVAPAVQAGDDQSADEGDTVRIAPTFTDVGAIDTHIASINWGDNTPVTDIDPAASPVSAQHQYGDDGAFTVTININDGDGGIGTDELTVTVTNVPPLVDAGPDKAAVAGASITLEGSFEDPGFLDDHTIVWGLGDGSPVTDDLTPDHVYDEGTFTATLTVTDDDGGSDSDTIQVIALPEASLDDRVEASDLVLSTTTPQAGEPVSARFVITNLSDDDDIDALTIVLFVNGETEVEFNTALPAGGSRTLRIPRGRGIVRTEPGVYAVQVGTQLQTFSISPPKIVVSNLQTIPRTAGPTSIIEISADVTNEGGVAGTVPIDLRVDDDSVIGEVRLPPGGTASVVRFVPIPAELPAAGDHQRRTAQREGRRRERLLSHREAGPVRQGAYKVPLRPRHHHGYRRRGQHPRPRRGRGNRDR